MYFSAFTKAQPPFVVYFENQESAEKIIFHRLIKNAQMQAARSAFHLPVRQAILRSGAYLNVSCNDEG